MATNAETDLCRLMAWLSPSFPVGAFSYSHGIEYAVEAGLVCDRARLQDWIGDILAFGSGRTDGLLLRASWDAVMARDEDRFIQAAEWATAFRATPEMALETTAQGEAFLVAATAAWPDTDLGRWRAALTAVACPACYPIVVGAAAASAGLALPMTLTAFLHAFVANLVSAGVRLIPLGQTDGQRIIAALEGPVIDEASAIAEMTEVRLPGDLCAATPVVDWTSMKHETQYTRLFRS